MGGRPASRFGAVAVGLIAASALALPLLGASAAAADFTVCAGGVDAGQCSNPEGVAVDFVTKRVYVADRGNSRIDVFAVEGSAVNFLFAFGWGVDTGSPAFEKCTTYSGCQAGLEGPGDGQFIGPRRVAVDNSAGSHALYVYDAGNFRVQKFSPEGVFVDKVGGVKGIGPEQFNDIEDLIAVGPGGVVYVADMIQFDKEPRLMRFTPSLEAIGECEPEHDDRLNVGLAVDSVGNMLATFNNGQLFKFKADCSLFGPPYEPLEPGVEGEPGPEGKGVAVDGTDDLYVVRRVSAAKAGSYRTITKYTPAGAIQRRYGYGSLANPNFGVAPLASPIGDVFVTDGPAGLKYLKEPAPGPVIASVFTPTPPGNVRTTLEAEVNPSGKASSFHFEYLDDASFKEQGESFTGLKTKSTPVTALPGAADFELHLASAEVGCPNPVEEADDPESKCLLPATLYHFQVKASNADGEGNSPLAGTFTTDPPLEIQASFASEVGVDSARLSARVNPLGIPATGYFEYVDDASFQESGFAKATQVPAVGKGAGPLDFGAGNAGVTRSAVLSLQPATTYHFRARAIDPLIGEALLGPERTFRTLDAEAVEPCPANAAFREGASALLPDCRAYELVSPLEKEGGDVIALAEEGYILPGVLNQSSLDGAKMVYGSYRAFGDAKASPKTAQYLAARTPSGWRSHYILGPREEVLTATSESELKALSPDLCQAWFRTQAEPPLAAKAVPGRINIYHRTDQECGAESYEALTTAPPPHDFGALEVQGTSEDGTKAIYATTDNLTADAPDLGGKGLALYFQEEGEGAPRFVCRGPSGTAIAEACAAGTTAEQTGKGREPSLWNAISADGERVYWTQTKSSFPGPGRIYLRERPGRPQSKVVAGKCTEAARACTLDVSKAAEETEGTTSSQYWWAADDGSSAIFSTGGTLYRFTVAGEATSEIASGVIGVMGASEDAARVYFASTEVLSGANPQGKAPAAGQPNLYLSEGGDTDFVATLQSSSDLDPSQHAAINTQPVHRTARVAPDGLTAAFMSTGSPTGYENTDAKSGQPDTEVFRYDAAANGGEGQLACVSCNPSGGRPSGKTVTRGSDGFQGAGWMPPWSKSLYPGRLISEDGSRLFFEAADALVPRDGNGTTDLYQWEQAGAGGCDTSDPAYSELNEGCLSLISSGQAAGEVLFLDASPTGADVFFTTLASLVPEDYGLVDVYDARVGGGLPSPPIPPPECEGESCQSPAPAPEMTPGGSLGYQGPGDLEAAAKPRRCPRGKVRKNGHCVKKAKAKSKRSGKRHQRGAAR